MEGRPATTVRAPDAATADALATVLGVLDWEEARALVGTLPGVERLTSTMVMKRLDTGAPGPRL